VLPYTVNIVIHIQTHRGASKLLAVSKQINKQLFVLFQLNAHNMLNTCIYHQLPPTYFGFVTSSSGRPLSYFPQKNCTLFAMLLRGLYHKMLSISCFL